MNKTYKTLSDFGLSENEIKVYLEALKHNETSPFEIARLTNIPRTTVYDVIMNLSLKGLIELTLSKGLEKQQTKIKAKNPSVLRSIIWERRNNLTKMEVDVLDILTDLKEGYHREESNADFQFFPGIKGARDVLLNVNKGKVNIPLYIWNCLLPMDSFGKEFTNEMVKKELEMRGKQHTQAKNIIPLNEWTKHVISYQYSLDPNYIMHNQFRYIERSGFTINQEIYLWSDNISIICTHEEENWGLRLHSKSLVKTFYSLFEFMWGSAIPITKAIVESWGENEFYKAEQKRK